MGSYIIKKMPESSCATIDPITDMQYATELRSYKGACKLDADFQSFDLTLHTSTNHVINTLAVGVELRSLSFVSLKQITECLLDINQEVVKVTLNCKKDIWKSQELFELVEEYFENSLQTSNFFTTLDKCLQRARGQPIAYPREIPLHIVYEFVNS